MTKTKNKPKAPTSWRDQPIPDDYVDFKILHTLNGQCGTADDLEAGEISSTTSVDGWHRLCPIAYLGGGRLTICTHDWHDANPRCRVCRQDRHHDYLDGTSACLDRALCFETRETDMATDPRFERLRAIVARAQVESEGVRAERRERRESSPGRPSSGSCHHCGGPTKGGKFIAGHDAKLKGELIREATAEAVAEAMFRGWYKIGRYPELEPLASKIVDERGSEEFIQERNEARQGRYERGEDQ